MNGSAVIGFLLILASAVRADGGGGGGGFESVPFGFYDELMKNSETERCGTDVRGMLDGAENLEKWALESRFFYYFFF